MRIRKAILKGREERFELNGKAVELRYTHRSSEQKHSLFIDGVFAQFIESPSVAISVIDHFCG